MLSIVVAIMPEAKPIIEHYSLKRDESNHNNVWRSKDLNFELIITGARLSNVAAGVGAVGQRGNKWLNIGVCGHRSEEVGSIFMASKIIYDEFVDYPIFLFEPPCPLKEVKSIMQIETEYPQDVLYEMEAHGFFKAALRYSSAEIIHLVKIVSDNKKSSVFHLTKAQVTDLVRNQMPVIEKIINELVSLPSHEPEKDISFYLNNWHFTQTQKIQLRSILTNKEHMCGRDYVRDCKSAKELLEKLSEKKRLLANGPVE